MRSTLKERNHHLAQGTPRPPPRPSNRSSGQVSILLDRNRKEGAYPPLPLAQERNSPLPKKGQGSIILT